jgi:hypothetical protein
LPRNGARALNSTMAESDKTGGKAGQRAARKARLAAALRENLKRRKQQARQRAVAYKKPPAELSSRDAELAGAPDFRRNRDKE